MATFFLLCSGVIKISFFQVWGNMHWVSLRHSENNINYILNSLCHLFSLLEFQGIVPQKAKVQSVVND